MLWKAICLIAFAYVLFNIEFCLLITLIFNAYPIVTRSYFLFGIDMLQVKCYNYQRNQLTAEDVGSFMLLG